MLLATICFPLHFLCVASGKEEDSHGRLGSNLETPRENTGCVSKTLDANDQRVPSQQKHQHQVRVHHDDDDTPNAGKVSRPGTIARP